MYLKHTKCGAYCGESDACFKKGKKTEKSLKKLIKQLHGIRKRQMQI